MRSYEQNPRPIVMAYVNPVASHVVSEFPELLPGRLALVERVKFLAFSPYRLEIFATREAVPEMVRLAWPA